MHYTNQKLEAELQKIAQEREEHCCAFSYFARSAACRPLYSAARSAEVCRRLRTVSGSNSGPKRGDVLTRNFVREPDP